MPFVARIAVLSLTLSVAWTAAAQTTPDAAPRRTAPATTAAPTTDATPASGAAARPDTEAASAPTAETPAGTPATDTSAEPATTDADADADAAADAAPATDDAAAADPDATAGTDATSAGTPAELIDRSGGATALPDQARGYAEAPGVEADDVVLFLPRVLLLAPGLVLDVAFWPLRQALIAVDRYYVVEHVEDVLYFDDAHEFGWSPTLSLQSGFGPTVGVKLSHSSLLDHDELLEVSAKYGGRYTQAYRVRFEGERVAGSRAWVESQLAYQAEPGLLFAGYGFGGNTPPGALAAPRETHRLTYFAQERGLGLLRLGYTAGELGHIIKPGVSVIANHRAFSPADVSKTQIGLVYDTAQLPGFDDDISTLELQGNLVVDLRASRGLDSTGTYLELFAGGVPALADFHYGHYGGELAVTIDLFRRTRLLTLRTALEAVEGDMEKIPFTDLPRLGGPHRLRGYLEDRFRDRRAALATVEYHYPIHKNVLGQLFVDAGRVSDHYGDLYDLDEWKLGYGGGLIVGSEDDITLRLDLSYGDDFQFFVSSDLARAFDGRSAQL